jgi:DNA-3-methyladenine glycosylase I
MSYCSFCEGLEVGNVHRVYHDHEYGFPIDNDNELFGRLILEINQAGLSWETILKKQSNFKDAYYNYEIERIANFNETDVDQLLSNAGIIRNKLKINSVIYNAQQVLRIRKEYGTFSTWLDHNHPLSKEEWTKLFRKTFKFVGGEIVNEFLTSSGYLKGAHDESCPVFDIVMSQGPKWKEL